MTSAFRHHWFLNDDDSIGLFEEPYEGYEGVMRMDLMPSHLVIYQTAADTWELRTKFDTVATRKHPVSTVALRELMAIGETFDFIAWSMARGTATPPGQDRYAERPNSAQYTSEQQDLYDMYGGSNMYDSIEEFFASDAMDCPD